jgi:hypothetical protein
MHVDSAQVSNLVPRRAPRPVRRHVVQSPPPTAAGAGWGSLELNMGLQFLTFSGSRYSTMMPWRMIGDRIAPAGCGS